MKNIISTVFIFMLSVPFIYGASDHYEISGKLSTVVACVAVVLIGIALFLFYLERRIAKLEKEYED